MSARIPILNGSSINPHPMQRVVGWATLSDRGLAIEIAGTAWDLEKIKSVFGNVEFRVEEEIPQVEKPHFKKFTILNWCLP